MADERRAKLSIKLREFLGSSNVYFQPPENKVLKYPCVVYKRSTPDVKTASNKTYIYSQYYEVTIIDRDPDSGLPRKFGEMFETAEGVTNFISDNLHHDVFTIWTR